MNFHSFVVRLARANNGVAMVEFAFVAPLLLLLILGGVELANFALAHMRVNQIAVTVADNAGRVNTAIDEANIHEIFAGAALLGNSIDFKSNGRVVLSSLQDNKQNGNAKGQVINWQRCWGDLDIDPAYGEEGDGRWDATLKNGLGKGNNKIASGGDTAVMFVEVSYNYQPLVGDEWFDKPQIRAESAFNVRSRKNNNMNNAQALEVLDCD